ncbi:MAG: hypothetical protein AAF965_08650 [Pseudomonadota bacterium]
MKKFLIVGCVALAGCATPPLEIKGGPVNYSKQSGFASSTHKGDVFVPVRTYARVKEAGKANPVAKEFAGASCQLAGPGYRSAFASPAILKMPSFGPTSKPAEVTCRVKGQEAAQAARPFNATLALIEAKAANNGNAVGGLVGLLVTDISYQIRQSNRDPAKDQYSYQPINVNFEDVIE